MILHQSDTRLRLTASRRRLCYPRRRRLRLAVKRLRLWSLLLTSALLVFLRSASAAAPGAADFESAIAPILIKRCVECHREPSPAGDLLLTTREGFFRGGDSGSVLDLESPQDSYLLARVEEGEMPPEQQGQSRKLHKSEIELLQRWFAAGAPWPDGRKLDLFERTTEVRAGRDWWSLQPIVKPQVPRLSKFEQPNNPIDAFVLAQLEENEMSPAPSADKRTLLRRLYYDLIGLPPTHQQIEDFIGNDSSDAWEEVIDQLLAMPQYGERWARYWLDLARYADTSGYERDQEKLFAWKYRDWVVTAFNDDMQYDQFIVQQIAGDEIENRTEQSLIATGFLRLGTWNDEPNDPLDYQYDRLEDTVHTTSSAFLGLTVKCARCHSHKFDPIIQEDYYRMASAFWAGPIGARDRKLLGGPSAEEVGFENLLAWTDLTATPNPLYVLKNGEREHRLQEVTPASLSSIPRLEREFDPPPKGAKTSHRRLQLARWIADPDNPLTPRVLVNRLWQHHFGQAIVRTPSNFGFLADPPTHPKLLEWLAAEFIQRGGSIKQMHKLILTSQTWRQASLHASGEQYKVRDSTNRLWWRAQRRRLDAEAVRDSMLATSGELDMAVGGESFRPTLSPEALEGLSRKSAAWQASPEDHQKRRSLYMYLKRGLLPPMMTAFDLCDATLSCGQRDVTIAPTQALALLNNRFVHDRGEHLAAAIIENDSNRSAQIQQAWLQILKRLPTDRELELAIRHVNVQQRSFSSFDTSAEPIRDKPLTSADRIKAALTLHLRADQATTGADGKVDSIQDLSNGGHHATQSDSHAQPTLNKSGFGGQPTIMFNGDGQFMRINGQPLDGQACTIISVASDSGLSGHREIISNWNSANNVGSSVFLGLTSESTVRFSDVFSDAGQILERQKPFIISAVNGSEHAAIFHNGRLLKSLSSPLAPRKLNTQWVIGQQGNINGEFWKGGIAEIRIYDRGLSVEERRLIESELAERYDLTLSELEQTKKRDRPTPETLALASLCHVLLNSNEFIYID